MQEPAENARTDTEREIILRQLGIRLREVRQRKDLRLEEVAERAGLSKQHLSDCERGTKTLSVVSLVAVCDACGILVTDLLRGLYPFGTRRVPAPLPAPPGRSRRTPAARAERREPTPPTDGRGQRGPSTP